MKKIIAFLSVLCLLGLPVQAQDLATIGDEERPFTGLWRIDPVKAPLGSHTRFDNVYLDNGAIKSVKGRDRLASSAAADITVKGMFYYENAAGSVKKILIKEADEVVSYAVDGSGRSSIVGSLTDEWVDFVQIGDTVYITSSTDGIYVWTGSGSAAALGAVATPSAVSFSADAAAGGMTPGLDIIPAEKGGLAAVQTNHSLNFHSEMGNNCFSPTSNTQSFSRVKGTISSAAGQTSASSDYLSSAQTTSTYKYVVTKYSTLWGIESEASTSSSVTLTGASTFDVSCTDTWTVYTTQTNCTANNTQYCENQEFLVNEDTRRTSTTATLAATPGGPYDSYRVYRTVAGGENFFLLGSNAGGGTYTDGAADASLGQPLDKTIDTIASPSFRYIEEYKGAIVVGEDTNIRFTRLPVQVASSADTYWLESDYIDIGTTSPITGLKKTLDSLFIFTADSIKELTGFGSVSFRFKNTAENIGAISDETIETDFQGDIIFFSGTNGVFKIRTFDQPQVDATGESVEQARRVNIQRISSPMLDEVFAGTDSQINLTPSDYTTSHAYYDRDQDLYFLYIGQECFVYDNRAASWSHMPATKMTASVWRQSPAALGVGVLADNLGFLYNNWTGYENGIESGDVTGTATAGASTTLTDTAVTFNTTGDGLAGLWVFLDNESNDDEGEWRQIASNTATVLTVSSAWTTNPAVGDSYYVAYIIPDFQTKEYTLGTVPQKSSLHHVYVVHGKSETSQTFNIDLFSYVDQSTTATNAETFDMATNFVDKIGTKGFSYWHSWRGKTYLYNTSNTIDPPLNILTIGIVGSVVKEK